MVVEYLLFLFHAFAFAGNLINDSVSSTDSAEVHLLDYWRLPVIA